MNLDGTSSPPAATPVGEETTATPMEGKKPHSSRIPMPLLFCLGMVLALIVGWWLSSVFHRHDSLADDSRYSFYNDLLGPIGDRSKDDTQIALSNPHVLLYLGLTKPGPILKDNPKDVSVPDDMATVLNQTANDKQAEFPFHHIFVDTTNYTGFGEASAAFGMARLLQATGRSGRLTAARFLNWDSARQEQLVILGAPH